MFETLSHLALQEYWWVIISILGGILVFLLFVQGGQTLIYSIGKNDTERTLLVNSLGKKWELTFTTLVTFGGAMFASFPLFYATSFGGAYWLWMLILFCFIIQAVSYEYRKKPGNLLGSRVYEIFLFINGSLGVILLGCAVATFFTGANFTINEYRQSEWMDTLRGIEAILDPKNLILGLSVLLLVRMLAALYFMNNIDHESIYRRSKNVLIAHVLPFLVLFISFVVILLMSKGLSYDPKTNIFIEEPHKYLNNLLQMPLVLILFLIGVLLVLSGIFLGIFTQNKKGIWFSGSGTFLVVFALFCIAGFNNTPFYPSKFDIQSSLSIANSSSSHYTLTAMSYVSLMVPLVIIYIFFVWRALDKKKITTGDLEKEDHIY
jgi:cytochrome bd ubiquinol oxidase subunit II